MALLLKKLVQPSLAGEKVGEAARGQEQRWRSNEPMGLAPEAANAPVDGSLNLRTTLESPSDRGRGLSVDRSTVLVNCALLPESQACTGLHRHNRHNGIANELNRGLKDKRNAKRHRGRAPLHGIWPPGRGEWKPTAPPLFSRRPDAPNSPLPHSQYSALGT